MQKVGLGVSGDGANGCQIKLVKQYLIAASQAFS